MKMMAITDFKSLKEILDPLQQSGMPYSESKPEINVATLLAGLELTDNQKREIYHIVEDETLYLELLESQLIKNCRQLQLAAKTLLFSKGQIELLLIQRARIQKEMIVARQQLKSRILDKLTADQRAALAKS
ncbi:MAG: hypothetical protein WBV94_29865 [Blastocatellia bacterium]